MRMSSFRLWIKIEHYENTAVQDETIYDDHFLIAVELKNGQDVKKTGTKYDGLIRNLLEFKVKS